MDFDWNAALNHPLTQFGAATMAGADRTGSGFGGIGQGLMAARRGLLEQQQLEQRAAAHREDAAWKQFQMEQARNKLLQPNLSKSPMYAKDAQGNLQAYQLSGSGAPVRVQLPEGTSPVKPMTYLDMGGEKVAIPYGGAQPQAAYQKTLPPEALPETRAAQTVAVAEAKATQAAKEALPGAEYDANRTIRYIDELKAHPGLESGTGWSAELKVMPGSDRADFETRKKQLLGGVFLEAYQKLKGGGTITEVEGAKAEQAMARMDAATSKEDFTAALDDYRQAVVAGLEKLRKRAGVPELPAVNAQGWALMVDGNGNRAYVGPGGEIEEVQ